MKHQYLKNVSTLTLDKEKCTGCRVCTQVCPHAVFEMREGKAAIVALDRCMECGACTQNCAFEALEVHAGVGCASAIIKGFFTGKEPSCGCSDDDGGCC